MTRILIADDNQANAELLEAHLDGSGLETRIAMNGEQTLQLAKDWPADVVLLDIMMPKLSGFEVCKRLRADGATKDIGVLMVTALDRATDVERAVEVGTDDFLTKPINKAELLHRIRAIVAARSAASPIERGLAYLRGVQQGV
ncbi:MAG: response regulator [Gemmataceae bacterium]|nr:response regulator [Gemmataceae bacterium]